MNYLSLFSLLSVVIFANTAHAQSDSLHFRYDAPAQVSAGSYGRLILPAAFVAYGAATQAIPAFKRLDRFVNNEIAHGHTWIDDYVQYAPAVAVYGLDFAGVKARNSLRDRTFVMVSSHLIMTASVHAVKNSLSVRRPDNSADNSFPSGHTATAFTGAHILFREYGGHSPWISVAGYATAGATGIMRMMNRKHWLSDVVAGAGIGILSVEAAYLLLPAFRRIMGDDGRDISIVPLAGNDMYGLGFACRF
ncbi:MAG: phosphatase PAP2 family protein [Tannerellaceae bacterium]|jgi:membrane-associated phospholipid phosphatase|nr:phosphatase PAP2 family protein [Tannerellaceae bacterium]